MVSAREHVRDVCGPESIAIYLEVVSIYHAGSSKGAVAR
jgi:hypothetical protein